MIEIKKLCKSFGRIKAINNVSLSFRQGEIITLLGPNGAGKSTLMRLLTGFIYPDSGQITILNNNIEENRIEALSNIGYVPENSPLYPDMTVFEYLCFMSKLRNICDSIFEKRCQEIIKNFSLAEVINQKIETLSKGFRHRVAISAALLSEPKILILDEPTEGLDPNQKHELREFIKSYGQKNLVIVSTHIMEEVEALSTRVVLINKGKIIKDTTAHALKMLSPSGNLDEAFRNIIQNRSLL